MQKTKACLGGLRLLTKRVEPELEQVELGFVAPSAPPPRRQSYSSIFSHATVWSRSTFEVFGRALAGATEEAGAEALPNKPLLPS